jgi:RNA-binding protein YlmH
MKFADNLTHRDFLGSLMGLGLRREMLGDIIIKANVAYLVCLDTVSDFIINQLNKVKHTSVKCSLSTDIPTDVLPELKYEELIVSSERLDVLISAVYNL